MCAGVKPNQDVGDASQKTKTFKGNDHSYSITQLPHTLPRAHGLRAFLDFWVTLQNNCGGEDCLQLTRQLYASGYILPNFRYSPVPVLCIWLLQGTVSKKDAAHAIWY